MEPRNRFQEINSAGLCSLAGRCDNSIPNRFLHPINCLKIPAQVAPACQPPFPAIFDIRLYPIILIIQGNPIFILYVQHTQYWCYEQYSANCRLFCTKQNWLKKFKNLHHKARNQDLTFAALSGFHIFMSQFIRARICKCLTSPGIDSKESIQLAYVAWRVGTSNRVVVLTRQAGNRFLKWNS